MPTLEFKGKQYIYSHHHSVPFRELLVDYKKSFPESGKPPSLDDNLIIHGDNLHALKALMPQYAGKIKCIYIDPPYNTGNEGWCYNDNVNSPLMKEWISKNANPVDKEDMQRHDKWLCMMYPRLKLLHELLADHGIIFVSIDDNEVHHLRTLMDEIFGETNALATFVWKRRASSALADKNISVDHEYVIAYQRGDFSSFMGNDKSYASYSNPDNDSRGDWMLDNLTVGMTKNERPNQFYDLIDTATGNVFPANPNRVWAYIPSSMQKLIKDDRIFFPQDPSKKPMLKRYKEALKSAINPISTWIDNPKDKPKDKKTSIKTGLNSEGTKELQVIFDEKVFNYPKPVLLIKELIKHTTDANDIILDSFAGSGTTAHAVLALNKEDGGNRKFILVEMEGYADTITSERVRRIINGVPTAKDEKLKTGLGGSFTFCELGKEISIEKIITGESLPDYSSLAKYVFYTATGKSFAAEAKEKPDFFVGETDLYEVYLIYKPDIAFLRSNDSALNDIKLKAIASRNSKKEKLVFATAKYMGQKELSEQNISFCQLPYAIHKVAGA
jgi:adenine-specific DNA-methyltransferase